MEKEAKKVLSNTNAEKIAALNSMQASEGWALVLQVMEENKALLTEMIIKAVDSQTGERLTPEEQDIARYKLGLLEDVMSTPFGYIEALQRAGSETVDFDPYYQKHSDIVKDRP